MAQFVQERSARIDGKVNVWQKRHVEDEFGYKELRWVVVAVEEPTKGKQRRRRRSRKSA